MSRSHLLGAICACFVGLQLTMVLAERVRINIAAEVTDVSDAGDILGGMINIGETLHGTYTYDTTAADVHPWPTIADYEYYNPPFGISINGGGHAFSTDPGDVSFLIEIINDHAVSTASEDYLEDVYLLRSYNNLPLSNGAFVEHILWQIQDRTASALSSTDLPQTPPNLSDWESVVGMSIYGCSEAEFPGYCATNRFSIHARVTAAELDDAVPVPDIKINNSAGPLTLTSEDKIELSLHLDNNGRTDFADWWLVADSHFGRFFWTPTTGWTFLQRPAYRGRLYDMRELSSPVMPVSAMAPGRYTLYFGVDLVMNGAITWRDLYTDLIEVEIVP